MAATSSRSEMGSWSIFDSFRYGSSEREAGAPCPGTDLRSSLPECRQRLGSRANLGFSKSKRAMRDQGKVAMCKCLNDSEREWVKSTKRT